MCYDNVGRTTISMLDPSSRTNDRRSFSDYVTWMWRNQIGCCRFDAGAAKKIYVDL